MAEDIREQIIEIGRKLHREGLLVRTWGNISARIDESTFYITPSGIRYEDLTPEKIVKVHIPDLSHEGDWTPSSEMAVHAACYEERPDISWVVHTHQVYASVCACLGQKEILTQVQGRKIRIHVCDYAAPGSAKLAQAVRVKARKHAKAVGFLMANHGTVCFGRNGDEAVRQAQLMEDACEFFLADRCSTRLEHGLREGVSAVRTGGGIVCSEGAPDRLRRIMEEILEKRPDVNVVLQNASEAVTATSRRVSRMRPLLDDFAMLIGTEVKIPDGSHGRHGHKVYIEKGVQAVFSYEDGAFCLGDTREEAEAVALILDKACIASLAAVRFGEAHFLPRQEAVKLHKRYVTSYGKLADQAKS